MKMRPTRLPQIVALLFLLAPFAAQAAAEPCRQVEFEGASHSVCSVDPANADLRLFWQNGDGQPFRTFTALSRALDARGESLVLALNGGMFKPDFSPVGLHIEDGEELVRLNTSGPPAGARPVPNFHKLPNGVFHFGDGAAGVSTTEGFRAQRPSVRFATQSGPMLVIDRALHPALIEGSNERTRRAGVGVSASGTVHFAVSDAPVNFHDFARFLRDGLGADNALYLDGGRGAGLYSPALGRNDWSWHGGFGPILGVVERR